MFESYTPMTRGMLVMILYRYEGEPVVGMRNVFSDVDAGVWYSNAVSWASSFGIVSGYGAGVFGINDPVTREQIIVILKRYSDLKGYSSNKVKDITDFDDYHRISDYAMEALVCENGEGLIHGRSETELVSQGTVTRAEVAAIFERFIESIDN